MKVEERIYIIGTKQHISTSYKTVYGYIKTQSGILAIVMAVIATFKVQFWYLAEDGAHRPQIDLNVPYARLYL